MKLILGIFLAALLFALPTRGDEMVDYSLNVVNAPGGIGNFSWTIETDGFIPSPAPPFDYVYFFDSFTAVSPPSSGEGCGITRVFMAPEDEITTFFSPLCDGKYEATGAGVLPDPGVLGTWSWQGTNPDNTQNFVTLTISEPSGATVAEPASLPLLALGLSVFIPLKLRKLLDGARGHTA